MARTTYSFKKQKTLSDVKLSFILSVIALAAMPVLFLLSFLGVGEGHNVLGAVGLAVMLLSWYAFFLGAKVLSKRDSRIRASAGATILAGLTAIAWIAVFILGAA